MFKTLLKILKKRNLMIQALDLTEEALSKSRRVTEAALGALLDQKDPGFNLYLLDQEINQAAVDVRRMVFEHLVVDDDADVTPGLILASIIIDIERIGDYGKNLFEQSERYGKPFPSEGHAGKVRELSGDVVSMFESVSGALLEGSDAQARSIMDKHREVGKRCEAQIDEIMASDDLSIRDAVTLALTCRFLKRISAHISNLASSVVNPFDRIGFTPKGNPQDAD